MKSLNAFSVFVFGSYARFIPFYIFFINKNYPNHDIIIFFQGTLEKRIKRTICFFKNVVIHENFFCEYKDFINYKIKGGGFKLLRWLIPGEYFSKYKYVYIGDVDILILKEKQSLFDFHENQLKKYNLPFSNKVRLLSNGHLSKRLTGLHFINVKPYYEKIDFVAKKILNDKVYQSNFLIGLERDEQLLYKIVKTCIGFNPVEVSEMERPWHGFHVGIVRGNKKINIEDIKENSTLNLLDLKNQLNGALSNKKFRSFLLKIFCPEIYWTYKELNLYIPFTIRLKYKFIFFPYALYKKIYFKVKFKLFSFIR